MLFRSKGVEQKKDSYWGTITSKFNEESKEGNFRTYFSLSHRWRTILGYYNKFSGYELEVEKRNESGKSLGDKVMYLFELIFYLLLFTNNCLNF